MPVGIVLNNISLLLGGLIGVFIKNKLPDKYSSAMISTFGLIAIGMGIMLVSGLQQILVPVVLSMILGEIVGEVCKLEEHIKRIAGKINDGITSKLSFCFDHQNDVMQTDVFLTGFIIFCTSATGIIGAFEEGISGNPSMLIAKSFLDFFTAVIFASAGGLRIPLLAVPQMVVYSAVYLIATFGNGYANPQLISCFSACGGLIVLASGLRLRGATSGTATNMLPALLIIIPVYWLWSRFV